MRFTIAGIILLGICHLRGEQVFRQSLVMRSAVSGIILLFIDMAVVMLAQRYVTLIQISGLLLILLGVMLMGRFDGK